MIKRLGIVLGLLMLGSLGRADTISFVEGYREYKMVCAESPMDLNRQVNAVLLGEKNFVMCWYAFGLPTITKTGTGFMYCQTLLKKC